MLFAIDTAAMNGTEDVINHLDVILTRAEAGAHDIEILDEHLESSTWHRTSRGARQEAIRQFARRSMYRGYGRRQGPHQRTERVVDEPSAKQAAALALTPLEVLAENDISDGALVEFAIRLLATDETIDICFGAGAKLEPPAFRIESRGGHGELAKLIVRKDQEAKERGRPMRAIVVADSDGEWPGDVKGHATNIRGQCATLDIPCPPLNKRTAENYIPDAYWRRLGDGLKGQSVKPIMDALLSLSAEQRDHIKMAQLSKDDAGLRWDANKPEAASLFASVPEPVQRQLAKGRFKSNGDTMHLALLAKATADHSPEDLVERDHAGDLARLVQCIEDEL